MIEERKIIIGLITKTEYIQKIQGFWTITLFESKTAKRIAAWCMEYYDKYQKAPGKEFETLYDQKRANGLPKDIIKELEEDILPGLSEEYENEDFNVDYIVDITKNYFDSQHLLRHNEEVTNLLSTGKLIEAKKLAGNYQPISKESANWIDLSDVNVLKKIENAFSRTTEGLIWYPGALGEFWNDQLIRGGFVALLGPEKRGKTFTMIDMAMRAAKQRKRVAFFEAGDMNEDQLLKRICIYLASRSDNAKYTGKIWEPVKDCIFNQTDICDREERTSRYGLLPQVASEVEALKLKQVITKKDLQKAFYEAKRYVPCEHCEEFKRNSWGTPYLREIDVGEPLTYKEAEQYIMNFFVRHARQFKIFTAPSGTFSVKQSLNVMQIWEKEDGFIPDVVFYDYPDIMVDEYEKDQRQKQNKIWMDLRGVSDIRRCLTVAVTQADADSYEHDILLLKNFSEDKRKYGHVTAMYGLNQDHKGREKELGIMRLNKLVIREGEFSVNDQVTILQNLKRGRPFMTSYK
jgi:hypothetical protein